MPGFRAELRYHGRGLAPVAGLDEAGRGAWAGPLVAGAVILPPPTPALRRALRQVNDSKQLSAAAREFCAALIRTVAVAAAVGMVSPAEIDEMGMTRATREAMSRALAGLTVAPAALLIDAFPLPSSALPQQAIIRGDSYAFSIAAASIIAKVTRDALMRELDTTWPGYGFAHHKGYGTVNHHAALRAIGVSVVHRRSFAPIRALLAAAGAPQ
ncbi:MAG: ribonuclease HII [Chloroflexi bacterium]|nr:ribonuclease HII [Chloroflexota bacterium]